MVKRVEAFQPETKPARIVFGDGDTHYDRAMHVVDTAVVAGKMMCGVDCSLQATFCSEKAATLNCWPELTPLERNAELQEESCQAARATAEDVIQQEFALRK